MHHRPDFLCVGAQKAGTSWLFVVMRESPGVFVTPVKESNYLLEVNPSDRSWARAYRMEQYARYSACYRKKRLVTKDIASNLDLIERFHREHVDDAWYRSIFEDALPDQVAGEVCPSYLRMPQAGIDHAARLNPEMKIVILIRDPVERFWSQIRMDHRYGKFTCDIDTLLRQRARVRHYVSMSDYAGAIDRWITTFSAEQVGLFLFDRLHDDPRGLAESIFRHIGADASDLHAWNAPVNTGDPMPMTKSQRRVIWDLMKEQYEYLRSVFPEAVERWESRNQQWVEGDGALSMHGASDNGTRA